MTTPSAPLSGARPGGSGARPGDQYSIQVSPGNDTDEGFFTETLARIYIKQGQYSKALEIIKRLNLNFPKKNVYFADQIRFLEKLIINNKYKKQ